MAHPVRHVFFKKAPIMPPFLSLPSPGFNSKLLLSSASLCMLLASAPALSQPQLSQGVIPSTSVVIVSEADGEGTISVSNPDPAPVLLHSSLEYLPEDQEPLLIVAPPVARVEAGDSQLVRFILRAKTPLKTERLQRVIFEGLPVKKPDDASRIAITTRRNMALLIRPAGLPLDAAPWQKLKWSVSGQTLSVRNDSPYVVRLTPGVTLLPAGESVALPRSYVLPGDAFSVDLEKDAAGATGVRLLPATTYGYAAPAYDAPLLAAPATVAE